MKDLKFTPGPWYATDKGQVLSDQLAGQGLIALTYSGGSSDSSYTIQQANADLIAKAPEMYEALKQAKEAQGAMLTALNSCGSGIPWNCDTHIEDAYQKLRESFDTINKLGL